jgi:hypothetical protein
MLVGSLCTLGCVCTLLDATHVCNARACTNAAAVFAWQMKLPVLVNFAGVSD